MPSGGVMTRAEAAAAAAAAAAWFSDPPPLPGSSAGTEPGQLITDGDTVHV